MDDRPVLEVTGLHAGYGALPAIRDINLAVCAGEMVALLGSNGAGKTTTLLAISGDCVTTGGDVRLRGSSIMRWPVHRRIAGGIGFVSEERSVFMGLTALDNLRLGRGDVDTALAIFPELNGLLQRRAGLLSGGEQQMLTLGRALAARPDVLLVDELSLGLAPMVTQRLMDALRTAAGSGVGVLVVEQQARLALEVVDRAYVLSRGEIVLAAPAAELRDRPERLEELYLARHAPTE